MTKLFLLKALHRLVEIHYHIGLDNEAKNYAKILGYNYNSSEWFKQSYKIFNKDYKEREIELSKKSKSEKEKGFLNKILKMIK